MGIRFSPGCSDCGCPTADLCGPCSIPRTSVLTFTYKVNGMSSPMSTTFDPGTRMTPQLPGLMENRRVVYNCSNHGLDVYNTDISGNRTTLYCRYNPSVAPSATRLSIVSSTCEPFLVAYRAVGLTGVYCGSWGTGPGGMDPVFWVSY